ncbi:MULTISPECIES: acyl-CoA dehydrogenase family protein [unclassified Mesorhizobium]|uniref:acyl-CoA dehydrogenase family protein n=1 Tax=unclassified Mesorhizobium TaxID=325217 RepID=UPI0003CEDAF0|nr:MULTISPECIES: acyl-CoA dehydrogenase family protein [unclassified Mesorhizobium]ESY44118.1 acyl-CoA dehydrogenase [Mesorhizobium sp. LNJC374B00]ESY49754.1 acyl-CoA dehydrogenase [Mesorhizobium sp. LNJC372A00]WJI80989.1 acyl-CoA dehydrogenase family protein [Mesorhizobium sp. C374B]WJI87529.1 acyl-CoA dehydrogenase family protein [Mesorhizobium sp. C372A]
MDLMFTEGDNAFREEVRRFLYDNMIPEIHRKLEEGLELSKEEIAAGTRILYKKGVPTWPEEYGGAGWTLVQQYIFQEEVRSFPALVKFGMGEDLVGPVIYSFGNLAQKQYYLPRIANASDWWCQGFSEPGAGSDLASVRTRAVRDGDHYVVDGQKIWISSAHYADWIFCLARTNSDVKKQQGISFLLIDMKSPGVAVRPIQLINGDHEVSEVLFDGVYVPVENLVGEENNGWIYAKYLLSNERFGDAGVGLSKERMRRALELAAQTYVGDQRLIDQPSFREKVAELEVQLKALEITQLRAIANASKQQQGVQAPASSILKLKGSEVEQAAAELLMAVMGPNALPYIPDEELGSRNQPPILPMWAAKIAPTYFYSRAASIYSGSSEIQKNIIAKAVLGL